MRKAPVERPLVFGVPASAVTDPTWLQWFQESFDYYQNVARWTDPTNPQFGKLAPPKPLQGLLAYADGTNWNPGAGKGLYRYDSGWVRIG